MLIKFLNFLCVIFIHHELFHQSRVNEPLFINLNVFLVGAVEMAASEYFITLMINNKLAREIRVLPSRGKKGGYIASPSSPLLVHIVIKNATEPVKPITFRAEDVETESPLEINEVLTPVSVTASEMSDVVTRFNITAPGNTFIFFLTPM